MLLVHVLSMLMAAQSAAKPSALVAMEEARRSLAAGRVEWQLTFPRRQTSAAETNFVSRYAANGDYILEQRGDLEGWTLTDGRRGKISKVPQLYMVNERGFWLYPEASGRANLWEDKDDVVRRSRDVLQSVFQFHDLLDFRCVGILPATPQYLGGTDLLWGGEDPHAHEWQQTREGELYKVVRRHANGSAMTWYINPDRGWNPVRVVETSEQGEAVSEVLCSLKQYDGVWLPESSALYYGGNLVSITTVRSASFPPDGPRKFEPADLGIDAGVNIALKEGQTREAGLVIWDGDKFVEVREWIRMLRSGEKRLGPTIARLRRGQRGPYEDEEEYRARLVRDAAWGKREATTGFEGHWTRYVREFIERYALDAGQTERAWSIHKHCTEEAQSYVSRHREQFEKAWNEWQDSWGGNDEQRHAKARERTWALRRPIQMIFEQQLKPRLNDIPTRSQRARVETEKPKPDAANGAEAEP